MVNTKSKVHQKAELSGLSLFPFEGDTINFINKALLPFQNSIFYSLPKHKSLLMTHMYTLHIHLVLTTF